MKLLITGVCGFVGSSLAKALLDQFEPGTLEIVGIDNLSRNGSWVNRALLKHLGVQVHHGDIRQPSDLDSLPGADWVIDAAANPSVLAGVDGKASSRQLFETNLAGTINVLEYCKRHGAGLVMLSSSRVYSIPALATIPLAVQNDAFAMLADTAVAGVSSHGIDETFSTAPPISLYGTTKLASEQFALEYGLSFDFPVWVNRCGVIAGAGQFGRPDQGIFAYWLHSWREARPLKFIGFGGNGWQVRDCLHPRDLANLIRLQIRSPHKKDVTRVVNVGGGIDSAMSLAQLSDWCGARWGSQSITPDNAPRQFDLPWVVLDCRSATKSWGWAPETPATEILLEIAAFADENPDWIGFSES